MFAVKNRICDSHEPPDRRISPQFDVKIKLGALHISTRRISIITNQKQSNISYFISVYKHF